MDHDLQVSIIKELLRQLDEGKNNDAGVQYRMPTSSYVCPDLAAKEWTTLFRQHPQMVGLSGDLPEPGSFFTIDDFGVPVLATRDKQGQFHAFVNACRHRGARVASEAAGNKSSFVCPFHSWTYTCKGDLVGVPQMDHFGEIDKSAYGLLALPAVERDGMLWVHPQPDSKLDIDELLGSLVEELAAYKLGELKSTANKTIKMDLNWKLANDTFGETYHFAKLHKNTLGQVYYGNNLDYQEFGRHHRFVTANKSIDVLRDRPESEWELQNVAFVLYYLFPNIQVVVTRGLVNIVRIYPDEKDPGRSISRITSYFTQQALDMIDVTDEEFIITPDKVYQRRKPKDLFTPESSLEVFSSTIEQEDYLMGEHQQRTAKSGLITHSILGRNEAPLHHFHNSFRDALDMPPLDQVE
ncbi:MAG: phenylpropionate dioxygenase-like ring-hydroxylating dioxygenase large terminal subunit [Arenicella sp.]|jgi:phenylpropionate dioxygenase-like ring-hydroxylating dioxygenase large terminal subunit